MSLYSKAWDNAKYGYNRALDVSAGNHWSWSVETGFIGGTTLGTLVGYGFNGSEGVNPGAVIGALGGAGGGYAFKHLANASRKQLSSSL